MHRDSYSALNEGELGYKIKTEIFAAECSYIQGAPEDWTYIQYENDYEDSNRWPSKGWSKMWSGAYCGRKYFRLNQGKKK